jgi:hypothetical protein
MANANSNQVKEEIKEFEKIISEGIELFNEYKQVSKGFVHFMNEEIAKTGLKFKKNDTLLSRKEKVEELYRDAKKSFYNTSKNKNYLSKYDFFSPQFINLDEAQKKQKLYDIYSNLQSIIKNMIMYEKEFIKYKKQKRKEKVVILKKILEKEQMFKEVFPEDEFKDILKKIISIKSYQILLDHLRAGSISNTVNDPTNNVETYKELQHFLKREKKMTEETKQIINAIKNTQIKEKIKKATNKKLSNRKENNKDKLMKKLFKAKEEIIKIYKKKLVGADLPPNIKDVIKILKKQELPKNNKDKLMELEKEYNELFKKIQSY